MTILKKRKRGKTFWQYCKKEFDIFYLFKHINLKIIVIIFNLYIYIYIYLYYRNIIFYTTILFELVLVNKIVTFNILGYF